MLVSFGQADVERSDVNDDEVSERTVNFGSQAEQIVYLRRVVDEWRGVHAIRARARDIIFRQYRCQPRDKLCQALAIADWVQRNITYVEEFPETFQTPTTTVAQGYGDCDDFTQLIAAMLESVGIVSELVGLEWYEPETGKAFQHIFPRAVVGPYHIPLDATLTRSVYDLTDPIAVAVSRGDNPRVFVA